MEGAISSPPNTRIAVVTGGNKGIGFEVCRQLASDGVTVVLTAAVDKLKGLGLFKVVFHQLDVSDASSIAGLANFLKTRFGKLDILVNNASVGGAEYSKLSIPSRKSALDSHQRLEMIMKNVRETVDAAKEAVQTNYYGTKHVIEALLPLLQSSSDGKILE
ncbi:hypothetical protein QYE76_007889 [Lolium multiflorum]|uniref:Uncharacterized protein n=1 Tax=Lolium multiflorum TaxID=4521 RepID=A0AAD8VDF3_LOLMU|nr:hypothetical protein QYE76_007889 [Lolium multiflorum]